jgi:homogentisate 1,2-dioxygenase
MPIYHKLGKFPAKRHTQFRNQKGELYQEELFGTIGFDGMSSLMYHINRPTQIQNIAGQYSLQNTIAENNNIKPRLFKGFETKSKPDFLESRTTLLLNQDVKLSLAYFKESFNSYFYKNADADELIFVHEGDGHLKTQFGVLNFEYGDYLMVPRGIMYQIELKTKSCKLLITESGSPIYTPKRYRNYFGQLLEHSPYCERDYKLPENLETYDIKGEFLVKIKKQNTIFDVVYPFHPFDVVGWDGYNYPYGISIFDFEPITGRIHQPPPVHQMFQSSGFVVCSFVPRLYDYHPMSIPAPYNHSNIDSDEVIYYVDGDFMSRNNIERGHITLHPGGVPHGPAPGAYERSIGQKETRELAVMVDTFKPLQITDLATKIEDPTYFKSWN